MLAHDLTAPGCRAGEDAFSSPSRAWLVALTIAHVMLVLPYTTGAISWAWSNGWISLRPAYLLIALASLNLVLACRRWPDITIVALLILGLLLLQLMDVALLFRHPHPDGRMSQVMSVGAILLLTVAAVATAGVLHRESKIPFVVVAAGSVCVCSLANMVEAAGLATMSSVPGRAAGFHEDPNNSAIAIAMMAGVFITLSGRFWWNCGILGIGGAGVLLTLSRSGFLVYGILCCVFVAANARLHWPRFALLGIVTVAVAGSIVLTGSGPFNPGAGGYVKNRNVEQRVAAIFEGDLGKMGSSERLKDLKDGIAAVKQAPLIGMGMGAGTRLYQPHNQIISLWIDLGLPGVLWFVAIVGTLALSSVLSGFRACYCIIPLLGFIPFSQFLTSFTPYWYGAVVASFVLATRVWSFRAHRGAGEEGVSACHSLQTS